MGPYLIVGAGITGLTIGYELTRRGLEVLIVERAREVGGLARSLRYGNFIFDIGPHRFNAQYEKVVRFVEGILGNEILNIDRDSGVYFLGKYHTWPLRPSVVFNLPLSITLKSAKDLFIKRLKGDRAKEDFESYILKNYGPTLYNVFFREYSQKFLGLDPSQTHFEWARTGMRRAIIDERVASRHIRDILRLMIMPQPVQTKSLYPRSGIGEFSNRLAKGIILKGGRILTARSITKAKYDSEGIQEIEVDGKIFKPEVIIWTGSLIELCGLLDVPPSGIGYISTLLFNIELSGTVDCAYQWCYYGSEDIIFSRITNPKAFSKETVPDGMSSLCVEVTCRENDPRWNRPEALLDSVKKDLLKVNMIKHVSQIRQIHIERIKDTYPIYTLDYPSRLKKVEGSLSRFENLILAGRSGLFWYNNMDEAILNAWEIVDKLLIDKKVRLRDDRYVAIK